MAKAKLLSCMNRDISLFECPKLQAAHISIVPSSARKGHNMPFRAGSLKERGSTSCIPIGVLRTSTPPFSTCMLNGGVAMVGGRSQNRRPRSARGSAVPADQGFK